jgi:uncharacterized protein HemX
MPTHKLSGAAGQSHGSAGNLSGRTDKGAERGDEEKKGILGKAVGVGAGLVPFGSKDNKDKDTKKKDNKKKDKEEKEERKEKEKKEKDEKERREKEEKEEAKDESLIKKYTSMRQVKK